MRLLLSSETLPGASPEELRQACRQRALAGLEVQASQIYTTMSSDAVLEPYAGIAWLRLPETITTRELALWADVAARGGVGLLLSKAVDSIPEGVPVALIHRTDLDEAREAVTWAKRHGAGTCWEVTPGDRDRVFDETFGTLVHVRLPGSGPEVDEPTSAGTGALIARLAMARYAGTVSLIPSAGVDPALWRRWLLEQRGWGCGTAAEKAARRSAA